MTKTVLVIAGEYPPLKTIGRIRTAKFVQHIRSLGWKPVVLTLAYTKDHPLYVEDLESEIPEDVDVYRVDNDAYDEIIIRGLKKLLSSPPKNAGPEIDASAKTASAATPGIEPSDISLKDKLLLAFKSFFKNWVHIPDDYIIWSRRATKLGEEIIARHSIDLIYTSLPPISACISGYKLKKKTGLPWVVDYRDLWTGDVLREWIPPLRNAYEVRLERKLIKEADTVVSVSEQKTEYLKALHPDANCRWETLTNGYDTEVFEPLLQEERPTHDTIDFVYTGRLFKNRKGYAFAEALGQIKAQNPDLTSRVRVHIYGGVEASIRSQYQSILQRYDIEDHYVFHGDVDYMDAMRAQVQSDYLLLIVDTGATSDGVIPGKLFEYIASKRPIFALCNPGATKEIIEKSKAGIVIPAEDIESCRIELEATLKRDVPKGVQFDDEYLSQFERRGITKKLAQIFDEMTQA